MAAWPGLAMPALAAGLGPAAVGQCVPDSVEIFRRGCLDNLPAFLDSYPAFERLGFVPKGDLLERNSAGPRMIAEIHGPGAGAGRVCGLTVEDVLAAALTPGLTATVAEVTDNRFRHESVEKAGVRAETFSWQDGATRVSVTLVPDIESGASFVAIAGEALQ